ncbi:alpha-L-fucosidase 2 precursor [Penicillium daleae]|uniref:Alpha-L-fucosidase 2 n=1 Tax=Penicillium daleae TaxID=63821 RepID=A0AAD6G7W9_9EURO|nr:alpha-L-fucosidase 2 precursor [Penicillium daleae]KAJ5464830.1 alpha-L-fucosidase 2 precursor [Penicillium daleae]
MVYDPWTGYLVTGPSVSAANRFFLCSGHWDEQHPLSLGPTIDIILVRDLFRFCITTAQELSVDSAFTETLRVALNRLPPLQIGQKDQLEWLEDYEAQPQHRHLSHTLALCRSNRISAQLNPVLAAATRTNLTNRQSRADMEDVEFTTALLGFNFARLNDGQSALWQLRHLISDLSFDNLLTYSKSGLTGANKNIFVFDGNMGGTALITEMLMRRSSISEIELLPALPTAWYDGSVQSLRARGNVTVSLEWKEGKLVYVNLSALSPVGVVVHYGIHGREINFATNTTVRLDG